jgi:HK97 gp10 family phage protein
MIVVHGVKEATAALGRKQDQIESATRLAVAKALHMIERRAKEKLALRTHQAGTPTPSGPGQPPALITGNLRRSISVTGPQKIGPDTWKGEVGPTAIYGRIQELGGQTPRGTLPARPYMQPAYDELREEIVAMFRAAMTEAILK